MEDSVIEKRMCCNLAQSLLFLNMYEYVIRSRRMRWAGHAARMGERCIHDFSGETLAKKTTWKTQVQMGG
jgi:hypothetical protein